MSHFKRSRPVGLQMHHHQVVERAESPSRSIKSPRSLIKAFEHVISSPKPKPIRILCLHGKGTSAKVLEAQMRPLIKKLGARVQCVFLNGPELSAPYHGIDHYFTGPYYSWYPSPTRPSLEAAQNYILTEMMALEQFDGVFGFSQGAAMAATLCINYPHLFKFAAFFCGGRPYDSETLQRVSLERGTGTFVTRPFSLPTSNPSSTSSSGPSSPFLPSHLQPRAEVISGPADDTDFFKFGYLSSNNSAEAFEEFVTSDLDMNASSSRRPSLRPRALINVPTVHLIGKQDAQAGEGRLLRELCDPAYAALVEHDGGHVMPRTSAPVGKLYNAVDAAIKLGMSQSPI